MFLDSCLGPRVEQRHPKESPLTQNIVEGIETKGAAGKLCVTEFATDTDRNGRT